MKPLLFVASSIVASLPLVPLHAAPQEDTQKGRTHYVGREIARTMHFAGAPWLTRESREREEECSTLLKVLGVQPGDTACDLGCGNGFYTLPLAELVGPKGKVLAVDIQKQMLALLKLRAKKTQVADRIETILGTVSDPKLPADTIDVLILVDVYHELSHPVSTLQAIRKSLKPGGRMVLAEFRMEDPKVPIKRLHKMSKRQILREVIPNGFRLAEQFDGLPWQHLMFFERAEVSSLADRVREGIATATGFATSQLAIRGGYAGIYSLDLTERHGEALYEKAKATEIWVQPPGTPSVGQAFLRAFQLTGDDRYFTAARDVGRALAWGQREAGGWDHRVDVNHLLPASKKAVRQKGHCTFDDNISQGALTFLIQLDDLIEEKWLSEAIELGIDHVLKAQFENGAWPQWYPLRGGYRDYYTFNDNTINDCIRVLLLAHRIYGNKECHDMALRGGEFLIASQGKGTQAGWAQQYSHDMKPAKARSFEPAAMCSAVTARNVQTLMDLHLATGDKRFLPSIERALDWLDRSKLGNGKWARFYELKTNTPIYGDRDGKVHYTLAEVSEERRKGYAWQGSWGHPRLRRAYDQLTGLGRTKFKAARATSTANSRAARGRAARDEVAQILATLDPEGRWVRDGRIHIADFVRNLNTLCDCLDLPSK